MKRALSLILALLLLTVGTLTLSACGKESYPNTVCLEIKDYGTITIKLHPEIAPITVRNFQSLVDEGFYDGLTFHRVIPGYLIQTGDPEGTGMGGSGKTIKGEFSANGVENNLSHLRGTVSMARLSDFFGYDTATSQFFIVQEDSTFFDGAYAAFGTVIAGMEVVDAIAAAPTDGDDKPYTDIVISRAYLKEDRD